MHNDLYSNIMKLKINLINPKNPPKEFSYIESDSKERRSTYSSNKSISTIVQKEVSKKVNGKVGKLFEENIRKSLEFNLNWEEGEIKRSFFYRKISFKNYKKKYIICPNIKRTLETKEGDYILIFNETNKSCEIYKKSTKELLDSVKENKKIKDIQVIDKSLRIGIPIEFEIDGLYKINHFDLSLFKNEIDIIYNNIKEQQDFAYAAIEIKLNYAKINELIEQLTTKKKLLEKIIKKKILYIGFVAYSDLDKLPKITEISVNFNCLLFSLNSDEMFFGRKVTEYIDWKIVSDAIKLNQKIEQFHEEFVEFKKEMKKEFVDFKEGMKNDFENFEKKIVSLLKKKRK